MMLYRFLTKKKTDQNLEIYLENPMKAEKVKNRIQNLNENYY